MPQSNLSPVSVVPYSKDYLVEIVRHKTGWDQRSEVSDKTQLTYLCNYLAVDHINAKMVIVEDEYVDRHYLEDYSEYYARCFPSHPRKCTRVHFFSSTFSEDEFNDALANNDEKFIKSTLNESYLGFAVIRPIPHTFLAKLCIKPYDAIVSDGWSNLITKKHHASLFGIPLSVETAAFLEQDKVVSACATSALWMLFGASSSEIVGVLPSPSAITKSATNSSYEVTRTFPTSGLTPMQVAGSLKHFGLEPLLLSSDPDSSFQAIKEAVFSYVSNNIPVLIGGNVYQKTGTGQAKLLGRHLVCALGFHVNEVTKYKKGGIKFLSHGIDKIYVHDDRYGPYIKISMVPQKFKCDGKQLSGLELALHDKTKGDYFLPDIAILGLYHKVRIDYADVRNMCSALYGYLQNSATMFFDLLDMAKLTKEDQQFFKNAGSGVRQLMDGVWEISLTTNTDIKTELLSEKSFLTFNGDINKTSFLLQSMPKYIWRCRVWDQGDVRSKLLTDILFDATEIPQGKVLIGYVSYGLNSESVWKYVEKAVQERQWLNFDLGEKARQYIRAFIKFFNKNKERTYLNTMYGHLGLPRRELKLGEIDADKNIQSRGDVYLIRRGSPSDWLFLAKNKRYIWVINELGDLVLGEDIVDGTQFQGHPTLIDGKPARLGGELHFSTSENAWLVNLKSRAYSGHMKVGSVAWRGYLKNVVDGNFLGLEVKEEKHIS